MNDAVGSRCPDAETLAAFIDGKLSGVELQSVNEHLRVCAECLEVAGDAARFEREEEPEEASEEHRHASRWWIAAAAAAMLVIAGGLWTQSGAFQSRRAIDSLITASSKSDRTIEPRLGGFPWEQRPVVRSGGEARDQNQLGLDAAAEEVIAKYGGAGSPRFLRATGLAYLLAARNTAERREAVRRLQAAAQSAPDAATLSDLAAARYAVATNDGRMTELDLAFANVSEALKLNPSLLEANFNRALILERLGLLDEARRAWQHYLDLDSGSPWANEAREHLRRLEEKRNAFDFGLELRRGTDAETLVRNDPESSRAWGEGPMLADWAAAVLRHDDTHARTTLARVGAIGRALAAANGERLLSEEVAAIERTGDLIDLANAHRIYDLGRRHYSKGLLADGERELREGAALFQRARSPMADVALYFAANTAFDQNRVAEARAELEALLARVDRTHHRALCAQELWELARCDAYDRRWTAALDDVLTSMKTFSRLGEHSKEAFMRGFAADIDGYIAQPESAARLRAAAFEAFSRDGNAPYIRTQLVNTVRTAIRMHRDDVALAYADLAIDELRGAHDPLLLADVLMQRARIAPAAEAAGNIVEAHAVTEQIPDPALRRRAEADLEVVEAIVARASNPLQSAAMLTQSIDFYQRRHFGPWLADSYLERARSEEAAGDDERALGDIHSGIEELEKQRSSLADAEKRAAFFDTEPSLFEEGVALLLRDGHPRQAFAMAERTKGRTLREETGAAGSAPQQPPPGEAIVEYALIPKGVAIFALTHGGLQARSVPIARNSLEEKIDAFESDLQERAPLEHVRREGQELDALLIAPVGNALAGVGAVTFVPDRDLGRVPYAALVDKSTGRYRIEEFAIALAPSASLIAPKKPLVPGNALIIGNPTRTDLPPLPGAEEEARAIAKLYPGATLLIGSQATRKAVLDAASHASIIHFAGHAIGDDTEPATLALANGDILTAADIEKLSLPATRLVVLAACGTASGTSHTEGMASLAKAFLAAGVPAVVATQWEIDDRDSASLFITFHCLGKDQWVRGLRNTQLDAIESNTADTHTPKTAWSAITLLRTHSD